MQLFIFKIVAEKRLFCFTGIDDKDWGAKKDHAQPGDLRIVLKLMQEGD